MSGFPVVDSHCHVHGPEFDQDREAVLARAREAGVVDLLVVGGVDEHAGHRRAVALGEAIGARASAGVHPHEARLATEETWEELRALAGAGRIVAIGEVGLAGEVRRVPGVARRLAEAERMGFRRAIVPAGSAGIPGAAAADGGRSTGVGALTDVREVEDVREAIAATLGGG